MMATLAFNKLILKTKLGNDSLISQEMRDEKGSYNHQSDLHIFQSIAGTSAFCVHNDNAFFVPK